MTSTDKRVGCINLLVMIQVFLVLDAMVGRTLQYSLLEIMEEEEKAFNREKEK